MTDSLKTILCIGDSLTEGDYGSEPEGTANVHPEGYPYFLEKYLGVTAINAGKCGFTSLDYWKYTLKTLDLSTADAAVIMLGTNGGITDTIEEDTAASSYENYADTGTGRYCSIIEYLMDQKPDMPIFLCTCPYVDPSRRLRHANCVADANAVIPKIAARYHLPLLDVNQELGVSAFNTRIMQPVDGLHGSYRFYSKLGTYIGNRVRSLYNFVYPEEIDQISVQSGLEAQLDIFLTLLFRLDELVNVRESQNCSDNGKNSDPNGKASPGYATSMSCSSVTFSDFHRTY